MREGFGQVSIIALPPPEVGRPAAIEPPRSVRSGALVVGALGVMIGPGSVWGWSGPDPGALLVGAPFAGAFAGACIGALAGAAFDRGWTRHARPEALAGRARSGAERVSVVVAESHAHQVETILRRHGATIERPASSPGPDAPPRRAPRWIPHRS